MFPLELLNQQYSFRQKVLRPKNIGSHMIAKDVTKIFNKTLHRYLTYIFVSVLYFPLLTCQLITLYVITSQCVQVFNPKLDRLDQIYPGQSV